MTKRMFRLLKADEIDCRVATVSKKGVSLLLYKDSRVDQNILDETVGPMNWQRSHSRDNANCSVGIWDQDKEQWIWKEDTGTESFTEKEKGLASDSFKRACFNWGIGRELYTAPFIWINAKDVNLEENEKNGKLTTYDRFTLKDIRYDGDKISELEIVNDKKKRVVYTFGRLTANENAPEPEKKPKKKEQKTTYKPVLVPTETDQHQKATSAQVDQLKKICADEGVPADFIVSKYKKNSVEELSRVQAFSVVSSWKKVKESYEKSLEGIPFQ